jgi:hypothetical protein
MDSSIDLPNTYRQLLVAKGWLFDHGFTLATDSTRDYNCPTVYNIWSDWNEDGALDGVPVLDTWYSEPEDAVLAAYAIREELVEKYI